MLEKHKIVIFPDGNVQAKDGMPNFQILYKDIKDFEQKDEKKKEKIKTKAVCDFGLPP